MVYLFIFLLSVSELIYLHFQDSGQPIPLVVESCIRYINLYGKTLGREMDLFRIRRALVSCVLLCTVNNRVVNM